MKKQVDSQRKEQEQIGERGKSRKLVKEESSNKSLKEQLDFSVESGRSSGHTNSNKVVCFFPRNMEVPVYSESTEAGVQKTLSARCEGDWTALNLQHTGIRDKK